MMFDDYQSDQASQHDTPEEAIQWAVDDDPRTQDAIDDHMEQQAQDDEQAEYDAELSDTTEG